MLRRVSSRTAHPRRTAGSLTIALCTMVAMLLPGGLACAPPKAPVIGLYSVPASACSLVASCGFNVIHNYDFETTSPSSVGAYVRALGDYLDTAQRHGLGVLAGVPRSWMRSRDDRSLREAVRALRSHPALFAWYEDERAQSGDFEGVAFLGRVVGEEDPDNGLVIEEASRDERLLSIGRARMFTYYPVTRPLRRRGRLFPVSRRMTIDALRVPFWPVLQAYGQDKIDGFERPRLVTPTLAELQYTLHSALIAGAEGVFFYPYLHPTRFDSALEEQGEWPYRDYRPLPEIDAPFWNSVLACAGDARLLLELVINAKPAQTSIDNAPASIESRSWQSKQGTLVLLANPFYEPMRVEVAAAGKNAYRVLEEGRWSEPRPVSGDAITVEIPGPGGLSLLLR